MQILQIDPTNRREKKLFLQLPFDIYRNNPYWVPPLSSDISKMLDRKRHPFYQNGDAAFFVAIDDAGTPISRTAVLVNHNYNAFNHENTGFFYLFESMNVPEATKALFKSAEAWLRGKGITKFIGSKGFTVLDGIGILVDGFDIMPALGQPYSLPYYQELLEGCGFQTETELVSAVFDRSFVLPEKVIKVSELVQRKKQFEIKRFKTRQQVVSYLPQLREFYNSALEGTTGNIPLSDDDMRSMASQLLWFADPSLIKIIMKDDQPIGFILGYPDISKGIIATKGKLFPFGWLRLLAERKKTKLVNINGAGVLDQYRGSGAMAVLYDEIGKTLTASRYERCETVQAGTDNSKMQLEMKALNLKFVKRHRLYSKTLV